MIEIVEGTVRPMVRGQREQIITQAKIVGLMQMTSNDIPALYAAAIERDDRGQYKNTEARERLADAAGELAERIWQWRICHPAGPEMPNIREQGWYDVNRRSDLWTFHGRFAPVISLDAAASIGMPENWFTSAIVNIESGWVDPYDDDQINENHPRFAYTHPADRATAECAARVYAALRAKEAA